MSDDMVLVRRDDLYAVLRVAQGYEPVRGSLLPFALERVAEAIAGGGTPGTSLVPVDLPEPDFDAFWAAYPRRTQKKAARKAWDKALRDATAAEIVLGAIAWRDHWADEPAERRGYIPYPASWLNAGSWEDELVPHASERSKVQETRRNLVDGLEQMAKAPTIEERLRALDGPKALGS